MRFSLLYLPLNLLALLSGTVALSSSSVETDEIAMPSWVGASGSLLRRAAANQTSGIASLQISSDKQSYYTVIQAGDALFRVSIDTASADLWLVSSDCTSAACSSLPKYPMKYQSSTFKAVNDNTTKYSVGYADGTVATGIVACEAIQVAGITANNQSFGLIQDTNVTLKDQVSGVLGLGFPRLSTLPASENATSYLANIIENANLTYPIFGVSLADDKGTISLGAIDASVVSDIRNVSWHKVIQFPPFGHESKAASYLQWAIVLDDITVNNDTVTPIPSYPNALKNKTAALIDVGSSGLYGPYQDVERIFASIPDSRLVSAEDGQWVVPCDGTSSMTFSFGAHNFTLQPTDYLMGPASGNPNLCLAWPRALPPSSDGIDWQIGDVFLRTVYSIFSYGINTKEPPFVGLYPLFANRTQETPEEIASYLASQQNPIPTTLPNTLIPTPTLTTSSYIFNTSVPASIGGIISTELAPSTYSPILGAQQTNLSAIPTISPTGDFVTFVITDASGAVSTSVSSVSEPSVTLGVPPGWTGAASRCSSSTLTALVVVALAQIGMFIVW